MVILCLHKDHIYSPLLIKRSYFKTFLSTCSVWQVSNKGYRDRECYQGNHGGPLEGVFNCLWLMIECQVSHKPLVISVASFINSSSQEKEMVDQKVTWLNIGWDLMMLGIQQRRQKQKALAPWCSLNVLVWKKHPNKTKRNKQTYEVMSNNSKEKIFVVPPPPKDFTYCCLCSKQYPLKEFLEKRNFLFQA